MQKVDKKRFLEIMNSAASIFSKQIESVFIETYWEQLEEFEIHEVEKSFKLVARYSKFFPTIAEIITNIPSAQQNQHIGADEAWPIAKASMNQDVTVCATDEILQAMNIAYEVYNSKDENPARMAFRDAYNRIVKSSPNQKPKWRMSLGNDKSMHESVAEEAVRLGRLPPGSELKYRIEAPTVTVSGLIEGYKSKVNPKLELSKLKATLVEPKKQREKVSLSDEEYNNLPWYLRETTPPKKTKGIDENPSSKVAA